MSIKSNAAAATLGALVALAGGEVLEEPAVDKSVIIRTSESKKIQFQGVTRFVTPAVMPDGGKLDVLLTEAPCVIPQHSADGGEDEVDCLCRDDEKLPHRWRGRNVCAKEHSLGTQCIPSACSVTSGSERDDSALY